MAGSSGVSEAGKAWITISVNDEATAGLEAVSKTLETFSTSASNVMTKYDDTMKKVSESSVHHWNRIADTCTQAGQVISTAVGKLYAPTKEAVGVFSEFDDMMRSVAAKISGATAEDLGILTETAKQLGAAMSFTATEVADGMKLLAQNGFNAQEINQSIQGVMNLARATGTDVATAADIASTTLRSFNFEADRMDHVCDVLTATANSSAQSLTDIGYAISYSATNAANAGSSLEDYMKLLGTLANYGQKGSKGGTALRKILTSVVAPDKEQKFAEMGISTLNAEGELRQTAELLGEVQQKIKDLGSGEQAQVLYALFGAQGMTGGANLMKGSFDLMSQAIDNASGTAQRSADAMESGLGGSFRSMEGAFETLAISLGESIAPSLQRVYESVQGIAEGFGQWIARNKALVAGLAEAGAAIGAFGATLLATGATITAAQKAATLWGPTMTALSKATQAAAGATAVLGQAFLFLSAHPIVALLTAVAAVAAIVGTKFYLASRETNRYAEATEKLRKEHQAGAEADNAQLVRLHELAAQQGLNNQEMLEASRIVADLNSRYHGLNLTFDATTGKIGGLVDAQQKLAEVQRRTAIIDTRRSLSAKKSAYQKIEEENNKTGRTLAGKKLGYAEYSLEELQAFDKQKKVAHFVGVRGVTDEKWTEEQSNVNRAVYNPSTGKYRLIESGTRNLEKARAKLEKKMEKQGELFTEINALEGDLAALESIGARPEPGPALEQTAEPAPAVLPGAQAPAPAVASTGRPAPAPAPELEPIPADLLVDVGRQTAEALAGASAGDALFKTAADRGARTMAEIAEGLAASASAVNDAEQAAGTDALTESARALDDFRQQQESQAKEEGETLGRSVADWKNGPGSAGFARMDVTDQAIVETAENTRITADYARKLYDLLKGTEPGAVFAP